MTKKNSITFRADGAPFSTMFNDIYFDNSVGTQQSTTIFIEGNHIKTRLAQAKTKFVIAETGFGTGLNFLLTWAVFQKIQQQNKQCSTYDKQSVHLHFISVEKYPLTRCQLQTALAIFPELNTYSQQLIAQYPETVSDNLILHFADNTITLQLLIADAAEGFATLNRTNNNHQHKYSRYHQLEPLVDAWYLDGFSPAKNPDMWRPELFNEIARLSKEQATLATFTVAGKVKRELIRIGFRIEKHQITGKKNEILTAVFQQNPQSGKGYQLRPITTKPQHVSIIGGGIASACVAYVLTKKGINVTLFCQDQSTAQGASSNTIAALYPLIHQQADDISLFYKKAFEYAITFYKGLIYDGMIFEHDWCGLLEISYKPALALRQKAFSSDNIWPNNLVHSVDQLTASNYANIPLQHGGLFYPEAGWLAPAQLVNALLQAATNTQKLRIKTQCKIDKIMQQANGKWLLKSNNKQYNANVVVYCGGAEGIHIDYINSLPLTPVRGQVTTMASNKHTEALATVICHKGYLTPQNNQQQHCIGATFEKNNTSTITKSEDDEYNLKMLLTSMPNFTHWQAQDIINSKARLRCMTPDHLPLVGAMPNINAHRQCYPHLAKDKHWRYHQQAPVIENLFMLTGLGARGLCTAPLLANILSADICGTPYPLSNNELFNLAPNRFVIRDIIRGK